MTRDEILSSCFEAVDSHKCLLTLLSTGVGKSKIAIDCTNRICDKVWKNENEETSVLIVIDKKVHKNNWLAEIEKWGGLKTDHVTFVCYASLHKYANSVWDVVVLDECHHIASDKRMKALESIHVSYNVIGLSATVNRDLMKWFRALYSTKTVQCTTQDAIDSDILPDPEIYLVPLVLDNKNYSESLEVNKSSCDPVFDSYPNRWKYRRNKVHAVLSCTKRQKLNEMDTLIEWYKKKAQNGSTGIKSMWMRECVKRLQFLAECKNEEIKAILKKLKDKRTLTFCVSIEQSKTLGRNCIHSKNKLAQEVLDSFNSKRIKHITACSMLNEGINLTECEFGIFANINSSETVQVQRIGRLLRHKHPKLIIPFFRDSREEEIVRKWMKNYNKDLIKIIALNELLH